AFRVQAVLGELREEEACAADRAPHPKALSVKALQIPLPLFFNPLLRQGQRIEAPTLFPGHREGVERVAVELLDVLEIGDGTARPQPHVAHAARRRGTGRSLVRFSAGGQAQSADKDGEPGNFRGQRNGARSAVLWKTRL